MEVARVLSFILLVIQAYTLDAFSCNVGNTYEAALQSCTDGGAQALTSGGNVSVLVHYATNLPNRDASGPAAGVSDPYVKFTVGGISAQTSNIRNNLNPVWEEYVSIGYLSSATEILVEIWDKDTGLEFSDDLLLHKKVRVPFCSTFMAPYAEVDCGKPFGCEAQDSLWRMPRRQQCNETGLINFGRKGLDLSVTFYLVPFTMEVRVGGFYLTVSSCFSSLINDLVQHLGSNSPRHTFLIPSLPTLSPFLRTTGPAGRAGSDPRQWLAPPVRGRRHRQLQTQGALDGRVRLRLPLPE
jgi:hypothetical protein